MSLKSWLSPQESKDAETEASSARGRAAAMFAARLTLDNVTRSYGGSRALDGVSLTVEPGEVVCLLGPSGCGKTTLLRVISGIERPSSGRVLINDREVAGDNRFVPPEERSIGLMFQDFALFPHLSILENVAFGLQSLPAEARESVARSVIARVGLSDFANAFPSTMSGGQQQRVALARAIAPRPAVMLMDEPFSGLDIQLRETMQEETLALLRETRATSLIVTHHPEEAMRLGDRIVVLKDGRVLQSGSTEELYRTPNSLFVARLFSEINEIPATVRNGRVETPAGSFQADGIADGPAVLGLRERAILLRAVDQAHRAGDMPELRGRIVGHRFLGDFARVDVAVEGFEKTLKVRALGSENLRKGQEVFVQIAPHAALVFAPEAA